MGRKYLFMEFPANVEDISVDDAVSQTMWKLIDNKWEAGERAKRLGLPWPVYLARRKWAAVFTVSGVEDYELNNYVSSMIRNEVDVINNPPEHGAGGCGCGVMSNLLSVGSASACGCGSACRCGE